MKEKVVLAYSGGLDTTALIPWLKETFDYDVVCCCVNCGQGNELDGLDERAKLSGASKLYIEDIVDEFCDDFIVPCVQAGAVYEHKYLLGTSMARPAIAKKLVEIARKEGAVAICHGATGKGNDQIRFELGIKALAPDIKIIAPWRMTDKWTMQSREDEIAFCKAHGIDLPFDASHSYSRDRNLWHIFTDVDLTLILLIRLLIKYVIIACETYRTSVNFLTIKQNEYNINMLYCLYNEN